MMENKQTKNHILKKATELFAKYGLKKTTMDEIAESAGLAKGTIYIYFESKEKLFTEIVRTEAEAYFSSMESRLSLYSSAEQKLNVFIRSHFELILDYVNLYNIAYHTMFEINNLMPSLQAQIAEYNSRTDSIIRDILKAGIVEEVFREIDIEIIVETFKDILAAIGFPFSPLILEREKETVYRKINAMLDLILNGLKK